MLDGFTASEFAHDGKTRTVYRRGTGPGVIIMHEIPGITHEVARFAKWVAADGLTVLMPNMFGVAGKPASVGYGLRVFAGICISREFRFLAAHRSSPITEWLRALCRAAHEELGGVGVGAIGMCLTGNFALAMMMEPSLMAPVLSQPSLPFPIGSARKVGLHVSPAEFDTVKSRAAEGTGVLGLRFNKDSACPAERFGKLREMLGEHFEVIEVASEAGRTKRPHSVLTIDLVDVDGHPTIEARDRVLAFLRERLFPTEQATPSAE